MNMGEFFNSLADYSFEDMQRKARMKEAEKAANKSNDDWTDEQDKAETKMLEDIFEGKKPERAQSEAAQQWGHFGDPEIMTDDDFVYENEGLADAINARGDKATKDVLLDYFKQFDDSGVYEKDGKVYLPPIEDAGDEFGLEILPENLSAIEEAAKRYAAHNSEPEGKTVEKTTVKVTGDGDAKKAADDVMPTEEFDKLIGKKPSEGDDEKLDDDIEAVMDMVYKLPPEKAKKIMDRLSGLNLGNVPSDKNVKKEC